MSNVKTHQNASAGFSLLEVLIAMAVVMISLEGTMSALAKSSGFVTHQRMLNRGIQVNQDILEGLMLANNNDPILASGVHFGTYNIEGRPTAVTAQTYYNATWTIAPNTPFPAILKIQVDVSWKEANQTRNVVFTTFRN